MEVKRVYLKTEHGYTFNVKLYNGDTYTHFECKTWQALCKAYAFVPDMVITFDIRPEDDIEGNIDIWVDVQINASSSTIMWVFLNHACICLCLWYSLFKNSWQLICIVSLFRFKQTCPALGRHDLLLPRGSTKLRGDKSLCFMAWGSSYCQDKFSSWT